MCKGKPESTHVTEDMYRQMVEQHNSKREAQPRRDWHLIDSGTKLGPHLFDDLKPEVYNREPESTMAGVVLTEVPGRLPNETQKFHLASVALERVLYDVYYVTGVYYEVIEILEPWSWMAPRTLVQFFDDNKVGVVAVKEHRNFGDPYSYAARFSYDKYREVVKYSSRDDLRLLTLNYAMQRGLVRIPVNDALINDLLSVRYKDNRGKLGHDEQISRGIAKALALVYKVHDNARGLKIPFLRGGHIK